VDKFVDRLPDGCAGATSRDGKYLNAHDFASAAARPLPPSHRMGAGLKQDKSLFSQR
jgi:hypothetical protein